MAPSLPLFLILLFTGLPGADNVSTVFTVSMKSLQEGDSGYYWCAAEIGGAGTVDDRAYLYLTVTAGTLELWVDYQDMTGVQGGNVSVQCHYRNHGSMKKWCRSGGSCEAGNSGNARISDNSRGKVFTVTVSGLKMQDAGWYWCAAGGLQIPVHITVTLPTTTVTTTTESSNSLQKTAMTVSTSTSATTSITVTQTSPTVEQSTAENWDCCGLPDMHHDSHQEDMAHLQGESKRGLRRVTMECYIAFMEVGLP
ncbi:hypothetical protein MATL_G00033820 [Megalops atlanticus]|uniref:Immunoglobulin domain-containing protein n=1 Tax=Megalops atlanticus TaxID=7932 RepID=A0A9D3QH05_MEGAT|nr:hypothetical protein MATL_G00033820 [Megalops atlanticus]